MLEGIPIEKVTYLAFKSSTGAVSDFIQRYMKVNPRAEWDALKAELAKRFANVSDTQPAFMLLGQVKQKGMKMFRYVSNVCCLRLSRHLKILKMHELQVNLLGSLQTAFIQID
jgi:hypothetical protein